MEKSTSDMRLVSTPRGGQDQPGLSTEDLDAARELAEFHRMLATELPPHSQLRGLMLRCGGPLVTTRGDPAQRPAGPGARRRLAIRR
jgi:hypothetical protein